MQYELRYHIRLKDNAVVGPAKNNGGNLVSWRFLLYNNNYFFILI